MRVRFAPSPSGHLHVGNARTALFNWLLARGSNGTFVFRIEDTDVARSSRESEQSIIDDLRWMGLTWDEGVERGGDHGPYRQSERLHIYRAHAVELLATGKAYQCFCTAEQLEADRQAALSEGRAPKYTGRCRDLSRQDARRRVEAGEPAVVRLRVPQGREIVFRDLVRGAITFETAIIGDFVLTRSNGYPAFNFAVVIDDALMAITHVVRGEDHISNTPRQLLVYEAFGWRAPTFAHLPLVLGPDHAPLSKRHGATSVAEFRERGYLPEALTNYLALLGWSPGEGEEIVPLEDLARRFDLESVGHSAGVFDTEKLAWVNRHYLKVADPSRLAQLTVPFLVRAGWLSGATPEDLEYLAAIVPAAAASVDRLEQIPDRLRFLFDYSAEQSLGRSDTRAEAEAARPVLVALASELRHGPPLLTREAFREMAARVRTATGLKGKSLFHPIRLALTGEPEGMELDLAVPAIERGAGLSASGLHPIAGASARAEAFLDALGGS
ncbi:MAG: glutamate--tRNA ligase [Vicinamibacterales bacterium]